MYLKNVTKDISVVINTVVGKIGIKPGEVIDLKYKILPPVSRALKEVTQEEYEIFCNGGKEIIKKDPEIKGEDVPQTGSDDKQEKLDDLEKLNDITDVTDQIKDPGIMGFVNSLINPPTDDEDIEVDAKPLVVKESNSDDQLVKLNQQLDDLKATWQSSKSPRKKERISKEIKEIQKQIKKLSK